MTTEERIENLERQNRWMKAAGGVLVLGLAGFLFLGMMQDKKCQDKPKVLKEVKARRFVLVDETGDIRGGMYAYKEIAHFYLKSKSVKGKFGSATVSLNVSRKVPSIDLDSGVQCKSVEDYAKKMFERNKQGREGPGKRFEAKLGEDGSPSITLFDKEGNTRAVLGCTETVTPKTSVEHKHPESSLILYNKDAKVIFKAP